MTITIDEAIEVLTSFFIKGEAQKGEAIWESSKLGIEALKLVKLMREHSGMSFDAILPGETKE